MFRHGDVCKIKASLDDINNLILFESRYHNTHESDFFVRTEKVWVDITHSQAVAYKFLLTCELPENYLNFH